jgi:CRISPR-associated protein Csx17
MNDILLPGCTPEPLANYLKCLAIFRLVGEQVDPNVRLSWQNGAGMLHTSLTSAGLEQFFLEQYAPTPILAPWNGGSGFYKDGGSATEALRAVEASTVERLAVYRDVISRCRGLVPKEKPKDDDKTGLLFRCRSSLPDSVLPWLDACFVLGEDRDFFPLLGSGGNDGNLEFASNFIQRLQAVLAFETGNPTPENSGDLLRSALFGNVVVQLEKGAIGQFSPGAIGGPNSTQGDFEGSSQVNSWDYILMMEGCLMFAGTLSRRSGSNAAGRAVFPFTVNTIAVGYGSGIDIEETSDASRSEMWLPVWSQPFTLAETRHLLGEGRAQLGRKQARNSVEFALAVSLLGVSRGIDSFQRYGFLKRNGLAFLATPLGSLPVRLRPQARLLEDGPFLDWLESWRRATRDKGKTPGRYLTATRNVDRAVYEFTTRSEVGNDAPWFQRVLRAAGRAERTAASARQFVKKNPIRPLQGLSTEWISAADDGSPEFRLALALASVRQSGPKVPPLRAYVEPVKFTGRWAAWDHDSPSAVWSQESPAQNLARVFLRRQMEASREGSNGSGVPLDSSHWAPLADVLQFLEGRTDDEKLAELLWGLLGVNFFQSRFQPPQPREIPEQVPQAFGALRLIVEPLPLVVENGTWVWGTSNAPTKPDPQAFQLLATGRHDALQSATTRAAQRLLQSGHVVVGYRNRRRAGRPLPAGMLSPHRLLAAMLFPLSQVDLTRLANSVLFSSSSSES